MVSKYNNISYLSFMEPQKRNQSFNKISKKSRTLKKSQERKETPCGRLMPGTTWHEDPWAWHMLACVFPPWACGGWWLQR